MLNRPYSSTSSTRPIHSHAPMDGVLPQTSAQIKLTAKEKQTLLWVNRGKSSWEIAKIMFCSESAINFHLANIRRKFGVSSRHLAVRLAQDQGLL
ncbi:helix-turn-helix transcriptional regulator [Pseudomonas sp. LS1212]|uniref:response regulator transcription factor n=1 Tax=Pseudomonas sp. LS1212 TaxID=2972478 RepID=UPI00215D4D05|nr:helix-turn-helix transcriptional regulator [Pseudomonas sp. LS1212]UVJ42458.1 helix-turn-helix transcriptional regulator [Pseudomonas sp. LS1212]